MCDVAALAESLVEHYGSGRRNVEGADTAGHGNAQQVVAGAADQIVESRALSSEHKNAVPGQVELVIVGRASLVETDNPQILALKLFESAHQVHYAGNAKMLGCAGAGFDSDRAEGS